ncbi:MAG: hypothetical protein H0U82_04705 [Actinobacteria bacterium]|nr:hypothetical protein [Actinomycetota bacterium]
MRSSISSSSPDPTLTVVIGANAPPERLVACLEALAHQVEGVEVRVHEAQRCPDEVRHRFPWASFTTTPGALVPHHWRDGIDAASGQILALTISQMVPAQDWIATIRRELETVDVVGGAIEPGDRLRIVDWAEYFCRYARDMCPFEPRESVDLPGDNAAYRRARLESVRELYRDGFWEPEVHRRLRAGGVRLWQIPDLVVRQGRSAGFRAFTTQRWRHGRVFGRERGARLSRARNLRSVLIAPLVPVVMTLRVARLVRLKRRARGRLLSALPALVWFNAVWAAAEATGHLDALRRG